MCDIFLLPVANSFGVLVAPLDKHVPLHFNTYNFNYKQLTGNNISVPHQDISKSNFTMPEKYSIQLD